jgi:pimeloyl-ACP methyl ester carboxylesterase
LEGPVLIFIHGVGLCSEIWEPQVEYFSKQYKVITYDFLGHGLTPPASKSPTIEDYVEQLNELVISLGISSFSLIGHSMGAIISVAYSLKYGDKINSLIPLNIVYKRSNGARNQVLDRANKIIQTGEIGSIEQTMSRWFENKKNPDQIVKINKVRQLLLNASPKGYGHAYKLFAMSDSIFENLLGNLSMPVLYLTGGDDPNSNSRMSHEMASESPKGLSKIIDNEAHMMAYIAPTKVNTIIKDFLQENE